MNKNQYVNKILNRLSDVADNAIKRQNFEKTLSAISASSEIMYRFNQLYTDEALESLLLKIGKSLIKIDKENYIKECNDKTVLFYDSFGLNTRGVAIVYTKAIVMAGYKLIYVTNKACGKNQNDLARELDGYDVKWEYIDTNKSYSKWIDDLMDVFLCYKPKSAFFYTTPFDVSGTVVFNQFKGCVTRYLLDLTDHTFWLGKNAADIYVGGRDVAADISSFYRKIPSEKLIKLDANLYINKNLKIGKLPFNINEQNFIFSGGALYKTLGDPQLYFYKIVYELLTENQDILFVYAGTGDAYQINKLKCTFGNRVILLDERKDFYQIIEKCTIYLNTYPMFGGLMMRYAANAGKLPITLRHGNDADGILFNQEKLEIEYDDVNELIIDVNRMINDKTYLNEREKKLVGSVMTEERFVKNIRQLLENKKTEFTYCIENIDTSDFRKEYFERFDVDKDIRQSIARKINCSLIKEFPYLFIKQIITKTLNKMRGDKK